MSEWITPRLSARYPLPATRYPLPAARRPAGSRRRGRLAQRAQRLSLVRGGQRGYERPPSSLASTWRDWS